MFITKTDQLQSDQVSCYNIANFMCNKLIKALKKFTGVNVIYSAFYAKTSLAFTKV